MSQQHHVASHAPQELAIKPSINTLAQGSMFWQPEFRRASPWLDHTPFLFWLVEALQPRQCVGLGREPVAHLALCQAINRLRLDAHCYLVAEGAALETGGTASLAEQEAQDIADEQYPTTSQWLKATPTRAIQQFYEGSIDLLLLNVSADDDSVDYLLDRWLSRLSTKGVVLLPGIARREPGSQVFRAFEALQVKYPHFAFHHGEGLAVIAVGSQPTALLNNLFATVDSPAASRVVQDIFARLGRSCRDKLATQEQRVVVQQLEERLATQQEQWQQAKARQQSLNEKLTNTESERAEMKKRIASQEERFAHERGRLAERVSSLEEFNHELKQELMRQRAQGEQREAERREQLEKSEQALAAANAERDSARSQVEALEAELAQAQQESATRFEELAKLTTLLESNEQALEKAQADTAQLTQERDSAGSQVKTLHAELAQAQQEATTRFEELAKLTTLLESNEQALAQERETVTQLNAQIKEQQDARTLVDPEIESLKRQLAQQRQEANVFADERFRELAVLTELLEKKEADTQQEIGRQARELAALVALLEERGIDYSAATLPSRKAADEAGNNALAPDQEGMASTVAQPAIVKKAPPLNKRAVKRQVAMIESSPYFDASWYLAQYPDIARDAKMSAQPARHYLLMGGFEGRNPGPEFDSAYYLATYPDVAQSEVNPLIHYLKFGEKEQRSIKG